MQRNEQILVIKGLMAHLDNDTNVDAGAQVMQRDEPGCNFNATRWGGCFCTHCIPAFRQYLAKNTAADQRTRRSPRPIRLWSSG